MVGGLTSGISGNMLIPAVNRANFACFYGMLSSVRAQPSSSTVSDGKERVWLYV